MVQGQTGAVVNTFDFEFNSNLAETCLCTHVLGVLLPLSVGDYTLLKSDMWFFYDLYLCLFWQTSQED